MTNSRARHGREHALASSHALLQPTSITSSKHVPHFAPCLFESALLKVQVGAVHGVEVIDLVDLVQHYNGSAAWFVLPKK